MPGPLRRGRRQADVPTPPFWGARVVKGIPLADYAALLDERATFLGQWGLRGSRGGADRPTRSWSRPRAGRGCGLAGAAADRGAGGGRRLRLLPVRQRGRRPDRAATRNAQPSGAGSPSRGSAATGTCAWPTSSGREESGGDRRRRLPAGDDGPAGRRGDGGAVRSATPTATTWSCTACRCSSPRRWRSTGTHGSGESLRRRPRGRRRTWTRSSGSGLPGLPLLVRLSGLPRPGGPGQDRGAARARTGSASSCRRSSSCTPSSRPTRWSSTTPRRSTSTPADGHEQTPSVPRHQLTARSKRGVSRRIVGRWRKTDVDTPVQIIPSAVPHGRPLSAAGSRREREYHEIARLLVTAAE